MTQPINPKFLKMAEELLPCIDKSGYCRADPIERKAHYPYCPAYYREPVALALQEKYQAGVLHGWEERERLEKE